MHNRLLFIVIMSTCVLSTAYYLGSLLLVEQYIYYKYCEEFNISFWPMANKTDDPQARDNAQHSAALYTFYLSLAVSLPGLISTLNVGVLSDKYGRKPLFRGVFAGLIIQSTLHTLIITLDWPVWVFVFSHLIVGLLGNGYMSVIMLNMVCLTDLTPLNSATETTNGAYTSQVSATASMQEEEDATDAASTFTLGRQRDERLNSSRKRFLLICGTDVLLKLGSALSDYLVGYSISTIKFMLPTYGLWGTCIVAAILNCFVPETLPPPTSGIKQISFEDEDDQMIGSSSTASSVPLKGEMLQKWLDKLRDHADFITRPIMMGIGSIFFALMIDTDASVDVLYLQNRPFLYDSKLVGVYTGLNEGAAALFAALLMLVFHCAQVHMKPVRSASELEGRIKATVRNATFMCVLLITSGCLSRLFMGMASLFFTSQGRQFFIALRILFGSTVFICIPLLRVTLTFIVPPNAQARAFALAGFSISLATLVGGSFLPWFYARTLSVFAGMAYYLLCFVAFFAMINSMCLYRSIVILHTRVLA